MRKSSTSFLLLASIALRSVIPAISSLPNHFRLAGISSRDRSKAVLTSSSYVCKAYDSYENLLTDPSIDAIYIPLPNALHYPFVKMALENGKHVLVEKSLGCTLDEVDKMVEVAKASNLVLFENFQFRFHSQLSTILQIINDGAIGDLRSMRVAFGFPPFSFSLPSSSSSSSSPSSLAFPSRIPPCSAFFFILLFR